MILRRTGFQLPAQPGSRRQCAHCCHRMTRWIRAMLHASHLQQVLRMKGALLLSVKNDLCSIEGNRPRCFGTTGHSKSGLQYARSGLNEHDTGPRDRSSPFIEPGIPAGYGLYDTVCGGCHRHQ